MSTDAHLSKAKTTNQTVSLTVASQNDGKQYSRGHDLPKMHGGAASGKQFSFGVTTHPKCMKETVLATSRPNEFVNIQSSNGNSRD